MQIAYLYALPWHTFSTELPRLRCTCDMPERAYARSGEYDGNWSGYLFWRVEFSRYQDAHWLSRYVSFISTHACLLVSVPGDSAVAAQ